MTWVRQPVTRGGTKQSRPQAADLSSAELRSGTGSSERNEIKGISDIIAETVVVQCFFSQSHGPERVQPNQARPAILSNLYSFRKDYVPTELLIFKI